jgi:hypothetical protein
MDEEKEVINFINRGGAGTGKSRACKYKKL